jgi:predicted small integral membrane protein
MLAWMAWTWETAIFFCFIGLALTTLTLLAVFRPEMPRRGIFGFPTTRGDRFFMTMIGAAYLFIAWMWFGGGSLWFPLAGAAMLGVAMFVFA